MNLATIIQRCKSNPLFVLVWTTFAGAVAKQLYTELQNGHFDFSLKSWEASVTAGLSAAALAILHLYLPSPTQNAASQAANEMAKKTTIALLLAAIAVSGLSGCTDWERTVFQSLATSKAAIDQAAADYNSGAIAQTSATNTAIEDARSAQRAAVLVMADYEGLKAQKAPQATLQAKQQEVEKALAALPPLLAKIKTTPKAKMEAPPAWGAVLKSAA